MDLLLKEVPSASLVVAIDPGKAFNRVWLTSGERGLIDAGVVAGHRGWRRRAGAADRGSRDRRTHR